MQVPQDPKLHAICGSAEDRWTVRSQKTVADTIRRFSVVIGGLAAADARAASSLHYLQELESENTKLRSAAAELALEISALRNT
jgi:hypothetical protein